MEAFFISAGRDRNVTNGNTFSPTGFTIRDAATCKFSVANFA